MADAGHRLPRPFLGHTPGLECPPSSLPLAGLNASYRTAWKALEERVQFQDEMNSCCLLAQLLHWRVMLNTLPHVISSNPQPPGKAGVIAPVSSPGGEVKPRRSGERGTESLTPSHTAGELRASLEPELLPSAPNADTQTGKTQPPTQPCSSESTQVLSPLQLQLSSQTRPSYNPSVGMSPCQGQSLLQGWHSAARPEKNHRSLKRLPVLCF